MQEFDMNFIGSNYERFQIYTLCVSGLFWFQKGKAETTRGAQNMKGLVFFQLMFVSYRAMSAAALTFPSEFKILLKVRTLATGLQGLCF